VEQYRFAGYRVIEFPSASKAALKEIAERLIPYEAEIVERWVGMQFSAWQPPGLGPEQLRQLFGGLLRNILGCMDSCNLEDCIVDLEEAGAGLARSDFPYEALIISLHFLEESYMPFLLSPRSERTQEWLIRMDEFLHIGIAALATSYFQFYRDQLLADAEVGRIVQEALFPHPPRRIGDLELGFAYAFASERARKETRQDTRYELVGALQDHALTDSTVEPGALYSTLRRLEENAFVVSSWDVSGTGPARRLYELTEAGEEHLLEWMVILDHLAKSMARFVVEMGELVRSETPNLAPLGPSEQVERPQDGHAYNGS